MKLHSKILTAILAGAMSVSMLAGCNGSTPSSSAAVSSSSPAVSSSVASSTPVSSAPAAPAAPMDIKWLSFYGPETNDTYPQKYLEEKFNIKLTNMIIDRTLWNDQLNVRLASGDIPDVFWMWGADDVVKYANQGVLAEIPIALIEQKMPGYVKAVNELEPRLWYNSTANGKNYAVPLYWANGKVPQSPVYNKAWLDKIGATVPKTLDEYVSVLTKFATEDPDGNGKKDTYGISFRGKDAVTQTMMNLYWSFGVPPVGWIENDAKDGVTQSFMTKAWKDATVLIQKLYKDGAIDPESITDDNAQLTQKFANKRTGVLENGNWYHWLPEIGGYRIAADAAGVELAFGHLPVQAGYERASNVVSGGVNNSPVGMGVQVEKNPDKMNKILEIFEALHSDKDTFIATVFGKEGDEFTIKDGRYIRDPKVGDMVQQGTKFGVGTFYGLFGSAKSLPLMQYDYSPEQLKLRDVFTSDTTILMPLFIGSIAASANYPDINNMVNENFIKFVIGEFNLEKDLEDFRAKYLASGGEQIIKGANDIYLAQKK